MRALSARPQLAVDHLAALILRHEAGKLCDELASARATARAANKELATVRDDSAPRASER